MGSHFSDSALDIPGRSRIVGHVTLRRLARYRFTGDIWGCPEGECHFAAHYCWSSSSTFAGAVMLETLILSILNHDWAVATAASRITAAAGHDRWPAAPAPDSPRPPQRGPGRR